MSFGPEHFQYSEPVISKVTDYIYVGNLNAAYNGRTLCRNNIDSIIDMSSAPGDWSRLKVDIGDVPDALGDGPALKQRCFEDINECINASTEKRKRVLVHCRDGYSLAPTCIIQYLMVKQNMRLSCSFVHTRNQKCSSESWEGFCNSSERVIKPLPVQIMHPAGTTAAVGALPLPVNPIARMFAADQLRAHKS
uniref:protein-tyrosine-phosphatase n=1 Tax=Oreochromis aureus TaxID=47969 RepID=A0A668TL30_OREAU